jgi:hypothetical protein
MRRFDPLNETIGIRENRAEARDTSRNHSALDKIIVLMPLYHHDTIDEYTHDRHSFSPHPIIIRSY